MEALGIAVKQLQNSAFTDRLIMDHVPRVAGGASTTCDALASGGGLMGIIQYDAMQ